MAILYRGDDHVNRVEAVYNEARFGDLKAWVIRRVSAFEAEG